MNRRRFIWRISRWIGVAGCLATLTAWAWVWAARSVLLCLLPSGMGLSIAPYSVSIGFARVQHYPLFTVIDASGWHPLNLPLYRQMPGVDTSISVPFWMLLPIEVAATVWLWRRGRRRISPGQCPQCGYDLRGNVSGVCPECGGRAIAGA